MRGLFALLGACLLLPLAPAFGFDHPSVKRPVNLPPSVQLDYTIKARQRGFSLGGTAVVLWQLADNKYTISAVTSASFLGKILENRSEGEIDAYGIAPGQFYEKRFRKDPSTTVFNRDSKTLSFSEGKLSYPLKGGEQDRSTVSWQLLGLARAAPDKFVPGSEWALFVAGRRDAETWTFKVLEHERLTTGAGQFDTVHVQRAAPPDSKQQQLDLWLAPALDWLPVRLRFTDRDDEFVEQTLQSVTKK